MTLEERVERLPVNVAQAIADARQDDPVKAQGSVSSDSPQMDWQQVALNGGPPCFATLEDEKGWYCGRALRWEGHDSEHKYVSLQELLRTRTTPPVDPREYERGFREALNAARTYLIAKGEQYRLKAERWRSEAKHDEEYEMVEEAARHWEESERNEAKYSACIVAATDISDLTPQPGSQQEIQSQKINVK